MHSPNAIKLEVLAARPRITGPRVGRIVEIDENGAPLVDFTGNPLGARPARWGASVSRVELHRAWNEASAVLLVFEDNDAARPVIVDIVLGGVLTPSPASAGEGWGEGRGGEAGKVQFAAPPFPHPNPLPLMREREQHATGASACTVFIAQVIGMEDGRVLAELSPGRTVRAATAIPLRNLKDPVLLLQTGDEHIVIGQLLPTALLQGEGDENAELVIKGDTVRIEAASLLTLHAGSCSIELDARGRAVLLGDNIVSRARVSNKVQGGSVQLN